IDGGSEDGSVELIKDYANRVDYNVRWISERDRGIYNAMNKGTRMSAGNYLLFLNAGDTLADNHVLFNVFSYPLTGDVIIGRINVVSNSRILAKDGSIFGEKVSLFGLLLRGIPHQGSLIRRELQVRFPYDEKYVINSDFKFFLEVIIIQNCSIQYIPLTISNYDNDGISTTNPQLQIQERHEIFRSLFPPRICEEYERLIPHYNEIIRIKWLLNHPFFYRVYRAWTSFGRILDNKKKW
ncbi:MAG: glycosyltransferase, partial [Bacteroidales bacterium]|nr:glycosyltransferase [Bacteroidales bacterium]